jgi:hypothetical protein
MKTTLSKLILIWNKLKILRRHDLLDERVSVDNLYSYLYAANSFGRHRGYLKSLDIGMCVDRDGLPIPWYTYAAIDQLSIWDHSASKVFEYGCGNSSVWWALRAASVISVESSNSWYRRILENKLLPKNVTPMLYPIGDSGAIAEINAYAESIHQYGKFDVIVIDGDSRNKARLACARAAIDHLADGGVIILDNADWHPRTSAFLRDHDLIEVDYSGLGPLNSHAETTSFFLHRSFRVKNRETHHPGFTIAGLERILD